MPYIPALRDWAGLPLLFCCGMRALVGLAA
jgi:hypothetical protein